MGERVTGFACGVFDLFHAGHARMLAECRQHCDHLIVAVNAASSLPADKRMPVYSLEERVEILRACRYVDEVLTYDSEEELRGLLSSLPIDVRFLGEDYRDRPITAPDLGLRIHYTDRAHGHSTTRIIERVLERHSRE
jgi:glycerol-3-phosphate cytidylyltransferase